MRTNQPTSRAGAGAAGRTKTSDRKPSDRTRRDAKPSDRDRKPYDRTRRDAKPYDRERKPFDGERKPYDRERKPFDGERKPYDRERKPFDGERKPFDRERKPFDRERKPFDGERKPYNRDRKPFDGERKPYNRDRKPFDGERKPYDRDRKPFDGERKPYDRERKPFDGERKPFDRDRKPFDRDRKPFDRDRKPFDRDRKPFDRDRKPFDGERKPFDRERKPFDEERKPYDRDRKPFDRDRKPFDGERKPFDRERKPFDGERKPYDRERKPFDGERRPFVRGRKPYEGEQKPFDGEQKPYETERKPYVEGQHKSFFDEDSFVSDRTPKMRGRKSKTTPGEYKPDTGNIRLNKFIANSGVCSRREADEYIEAGLVSINGEIVTQLGIKVSHNDDIRFNGERLKGEEKVYIVMNKPKDFVTTMSDPNADKTVMDLIEGKCSQRVFPVGRLDKSTTGVLLLTNDGEMAEKLTHPSNMQKKIYHVHLDKNLSGSDFDLILKGINLEDGEAHADALSYVDGENSQVGLEIHSGKNRIVRRIFEHLGYKVKKLDRVFFAGLTKKNLKRGQWRFLTDVEISLLKMGAYE